MTSENDPLWGDKIAGIEKRLKDATGLVSDTEWLLDRLKRAQWMMARIRVCAQECQPGREKVALIACDLMAKEFMTEGT